MFRWVWPQVGPRWAQGCFLVETSGGNLKIDNFPVFFSEFSSRKEPIDLAVLRRNSEMVPAGPATGGGPHGNLLEA